MRYFHNFKKIQYLITVLGAIAVLQGCTDNSNSKTSPMAPSPAVSILTVPDYPVGDYSEFVSRTEAKEEVNLIARVEGTLVKRNFIEGQKVEEGQTLFEIDQAPFLTSLRQAEAAISSSKAGLHKAKADLKRGKEMSSKGFISQSDLDNLINQNLQAVSAVATSEAQLQQAKINLSYATIKAPFSGVIGRANYSNGSLVSVSSGPLATLTSISPFYVYFQVDEKVIVSYMQSEAGRGAERKGEENNDTEKEINNFSSSPSALSLTLKLPDGSMYAEKGQLDFSDTHIDESTGTLSVRAIFPNPNHIILPGLYVTLIAESTNKQNTPLIPQFAVQENQKGRFVLVVNDENQVEIKNVVLGRRIGPMWAVTSGLNAGERIIVEGLQKVQPGVKVKPILKQINIQSGVLSDPQKKQAINSNDQTTGGSL